MKPALIIIDMQKDFFKSKELQEKAHNLITHINDLVLEFRKKGLPVVWVKQVWSDDLFDAHPINRKSGRKIVIDGTQGSELLDELDFSNADFEVIKKRYSGFFKTNLSELLQENKVDTLIFCGINTHACVRTTVIDAYQREYDSFIAIECVASYDEEHHRISLEYMKHAIAKPMSNEAIKEFIA